MSDYDNTNSGVLFREKEKKETSDRDFGGKLNVAGTDWWLNGWLDEDGDGKVLNLSASQVSDRSVRARGALRPVADKASDKHPDYKGSLEVGGEKLGIAGWKRTARSTGNAFISLSVDVKNKASAKGEPVAAAQAVDDDLPF